jgi:hypothetical protein
MAAAKPEIVITSVMQESREISKPFTNVFGYLSCMDHSWTLRIQQRLWNPIRRPTNRKYQ